MRLANQTRPDIASAVIAVERYADQPREVHWRTAIGVLQYAHFTSDFGIMFHKGSGVEMVAFADDDYASKAADRRSISGRAVTCAGACVHWFSRTRNAARS